MPLCGQELDLEEQERYTAIRQAIDRTDLPDDVDARY